MERVEIRVAGKVQGVGFRYFVLQEAEKRGITGETQNLSTGEVLTIAEGNKISLVELYNAVQRGPGSARVDKHSIIWKMATREFSRFTIL
jgi:acylphosphatase